MVLMVPVFALTFLEFVSMLFHRITGKYIHPITAGIILLICHLSFFFLWWTLIQQVETGYYNNITWGSITIPFYAWLIPAALLFWLAVRRVDRMRRVI